MRKLISILFILFCAYGIFAQIPLRQLDTIYTRQADLTRWGAFIENHAKIYGITTDGDSGVASLVNKILNIPHYTLSGLGGQPQLNGTGFVKMNGTTVSYDNSNYLTTESDPTLSELVKSINEEDTTRWGSGGNAEINPTEYHLPVNIGNVFVDAPIKISDDTTRVLISNSGGLVAVYDTTYIPVYDVDSIGYTTVLGTTTTTSTRRAVPVIMTEDAVITAITMYHGNASAGGGIIYGLYSDSGGYPSTLLSATNTGTPHTNTWDKLNLQDSVEVSSGQKVWLAWVNENSIEIKYGSGSPGRAATTDTYASGMPSSFGSSTIAESVYSIYVNYLLVVDSTASVDTSYIGYEFQDNMLDRLQVGGNIFTEDTVKTGSLKIVNTINEISTDGTMAGNSDDAIPTEKAVVTYVANNSNQFPMTPITLSGATPAWNLANGINANLSISANTTITLSNAPAGYGGQLTVINTSTAYTLDVTGYTNTIGKAIGTPGNTTRLNTSGVNGAIDRFTWYYDGSKINWSGELNVIK